MARVTLRDVIFSDKWRIVNALQGSDNRVRIDATRRFCIMDGQNYYSEWHSIDYVNRLRAEKGYCKIQESSIFRY